MEKSCVGSISISGASQGGVSYAYRILRLCRAITDPESQYVTVIISYGERQEAINRLVYRGIDGLNEFVTLCGGKANSLDIRVIREDDIPKGEANFLLAESRYIKR